MDNRPLGSVLAYLRQTADGGHTDHDLLERFAATRDEAAFATLMRRHGPLVLGVSRRVLGNEHDAEEVFQATFLVLAKKAPGIRQRTSLAGWLYQVAYRLALRLRGHTSRNRLLEAAPTPATDPLDDITWKELRVVLDEELARLPEKYRLPLLLCYLAGKTRDEAAEELGWTIGAVKGRLERGRDLLRERLEKRGLALPAALLATALGAGQGSAAAPAALIDATSRAAVHFSSGGAMTKLVSEQVVTLAGSALGTPVWRLVLVLLALVGLVGAGSGLFLAQQTDVPAPPPAPAANGKLGPAFTDITKESGIAQIVDDNYAAHPKWWLSGLHLVDLDGDGHLDLYLSAHGAGKAVAALNDGKGRFKLAEGTFPSSEIHLAYDIDEDGKLDLSLTHQDGGGKWWLNRSRPGQLDFVAAPVERGTNTARRGAIIDINRDGKADWLRGLPTGIHFDLGDGKGNFAAGGLAIATGAGRQAEVLCLPVDIDGDGDIDLISEWGHYADAGGNSRIFRNDGNGKFTDVTKECGIPEANFSIKGVGDVDQDGDLDIIAIADRGRFEIWLNDGAGKFTRKDGAIQGIQGKPTAVSWGLAVVLDIDNDGIPDILINGKHFLKVLRGQGDGRFVYMNQAWNIKDLAASSVDDGLCFGDIDGDGDIDIVGYTQMGGDSRRIAVYRNDLPSQNWLRVRPVGTAGNRGAAGAKIRVSEPGGRLLGYEQVALFHSQSAQSYYGASQTERHFGLGQRQRVDVAVEFYPSGKKIERKGVAANTTLVVEEPKD